MASEQSPDGNTHADGGQNPCSMDARDQILLKALQDLIIRVVAPEQTNEMNQINLSPEAMKLVTALREFVTSIAGRNESKVQSTVIEVSLVEGNVLQSTDDEDGNAREPVAGNLSKLSLKAASLSVVSSTESPEGVILDHELEHLDSSVNPQPTFQDKLLKRLREHVFNTMPIRMLLFEPHGSVLQIALVERGVLHARLASALRGKIHEADHVPILDPVLGRTETEEEAVDRLISKYTRYGILSHTWLRTSSEITYGDWYKEMFDFEDPGYRKLVNFCKIAWKDHGLTLGWMDTVCINKESSSELDESIRSMYNWYRSADVCITYLAQTTSLPYMNSDPWFTRGWTLQELLAPSVIKFYNSDWKKLVEDSNNDKNDTGIMDQVERATTITSVELNFIRGVPMSRKMQLAARREVTREEDTAYSLMGIFNVSISTAYGEGAERAFFRLLEAILVSTAENLDILNWAGDLPDSRPHPSHILPSSPLHYQNSTYFDDLSLTVPLEPLTLTHLGLHVPVLLMPALLPPNQASASPFIPIGDYSATVDICPIQRKDLSFRPPSATYNVLDNRVSGRDVDLRPTPGELQITLAVFNFYGDASTIWVENPCLAKLLYCWEGVGKVTPSGTIYVIGTVKPIVFDLVRGACDSGPSPTGVYEIERDSLTEHGMQLVSLYL